MTDHALVTWLTCTAHMADHAMSLTFEAYRFGGHYLRVKGEQGSWGTTGSSGEGVVSQLRFPLAMVLSRLITIQVSLLGGSAVLPI